MFNVFGTKKKEEPKKQIDLSVTSNRVSNTKTKCLKFYFPQITFKCKIYKFDSFLI